MSVCSSMGKLEVNESLPHIFYNLAMYNYFLWLIQVLSVCCACKLVCELTAASEIHRCLILFIFIFLKLIFNLDSLF